MPEYNLVKTVVKDEESHVWSLKVTVTTTDPNDDPNIFVYHSTAPGSVDAGDQFHHVANLQDMEDLPIDAPADDDSGDANGNYIPFYRMDGADIVLYNPEDYESVWCQMLDHVYILKQQYEVAELQGETETITI